MELIAHPALERLVHHLMLLNARFPLEIGRQHERRIVIAIAFQIVDDLLDYGGTDAAIGKNTGDDFRERKLTLPVIKAVAKASAEEHAFWQRVIEKGDQRDGDLEHARAVMARHGTMESARQDALAWAAKARAALDPLPPHDLRDMLADLADYVVERIS